MKVSLQVSNLNNSLMFYRALTGKMPDELNHDFIRFSLNANEWKIVETKETIQPVTLILEVADQELAVIFHRMRHLRKETEIGQACELLRTHFSITDPDRHEWIITTDIEAAINETGTRPTCKLLPLNTLF